MITIVKYTHFFKFNIILIKDYDFIDDEFKTIEDRNTMIIYFYKTPIRLINTYRCVSYYRYAVAFFRLYFERGGRRSGPIYQYVTKKYIKKFYSFIICSLQDHKGVYYLHIIDDINVYYI